jgi:hypothetical protein
MEEGKEKLSFKERAKREFVRYWIYVAYLATVFGVFAWYRRLILAAHEISYLKYGAAIIEALILAKVILIGDAIGLGRHLQERRPLIYPTLGKAVVFSLFVGLFSLLERTATGLIKGKGLLAGIAELRVEDEYELIARCMVVFVLFIPFFAFKELGNTLGEGKLGRLFFRDRSWPQSGDDQSLQKGKFGSSDPSI